MDWSDLLVPGIGAASALIAVGLGAWWQGKSSLRLLEAQTQYAAKSHHQQARHERLMRLYDEKRATYTELIPLVEELSRAYRGLIRNEGMTDKNHPSLIFLPKEVWSPDAEPQAPSELETVARYDPDVIVKTAEDRIDSALTALQILAPRDVYEAAVAHCTTVLPDASGNTLTFEKYIRAIRQDLGVDDVPAQLKNE